MELSRAPFLEVFLLAFLVRSVCLSRLIQQKLGKNSRHKTVESTTTTQSQRKPLGTNRTHSRIKNVSCRVQSCSVPLLSANLSTTVNLAAGLTAKSTQLQTTSSSAYAGFDSAAQQPVAGKKPENKGRPISSNPVPNSPWCVVWTGKCSFHNDSFI